MLCVQLARCQDYYGKEMNMGLMTSQSDYRSSAKETRQAELRLNDAFRQVGSKDAPNKGAAQTGLRRWMQSILKTNQAPAK